MMPRKEQATHTDMGCEEVLDLLHDFVANELEDEDLRPVLRHLGDCPSCRLAMAEHVRLLGVLRANMPVLVKPYFSGYRGTLN